VTHARYLRKHATDCERILWRRLRNRNFARYKFRRQHPIDPYVLDFYCPAVKLAVELDGSGHGYRLRETRDQAREEFLARQEIAVVRFWNHQVREELDSVLQAIWLALEKRAPNNPSPQSSPFDKGYLFSAEGAPFIAAWGSAPGNCTCEGSSAESAIHSDAFSVHHWPHAPITQ
jgi:very-short-patch-repair endonuclease